tara:strand:+ start:331 stop:999 length:669 start_codon:yes stop_codon:yes gene_type:complete
MNKNILKRIITSSFLVSLLFSCLYYSDLSWKILVIFFSIICFYEFNNLLNKIYKINTYKIIIKLLVIFYLCFFYFLLIKIKIEFGEEFILILLISCIFSDVGGYIIGNLVGGPKLTKISPNKTISGALGSILFTVVGTTLFILYLQKINNQFNFFISSLLLYLWLVLMSIYCQAGDLFVSYLKRKAKIKNTGNLLPGHGGLLDRLDGILFAVPMGVLTYLII